MTDDEVLELLREGNASRAAAKTAYQEAFDGATSEVARCWAAHMVAIEEDVPEEKLRWNVVSLEAADAAAGDPRQSGLYPTVLANIGLSHLWMAHPAEAQHWYEKALASIEVSDLPTDRRDGYRSAIEHMLTIIRDRDLSERGPS